MKTSKSLGIAWGLGFGLMLLGQDLSAKQGVLFHLQLPKREWA